MSHFMDAPNFFHSLTMSLIGWPCTVDAWQIHDRIKKSLQRASELLHKRNTRAKTSIVHIHVSNGHDEAIMNIIGTPEGLFDSLGDLLMRIDNKVQIETSATDEESLKYCAKISALRAFYDTIENE